MTSQGGYRGRGGRGRQLYAQRTGEGQSHAPGLELDEYEYEDLKRKYTPDMQFMKDIVTGKPIPIINRQWTRTLRPTTEESITTGIKGVVAIMAQPFGMVRNLIQLGYEPVPVQVKPGWYKGQVIRKLPSVFEYIGILRRTYGTTALFLGADVRMMAVMTESLTSITAKKLCCRALGVNYMSLSQNFSLAYAETAISMGRLPTIIERLTWLWKELFVEIVGGVVGVVFAKPFHTLMVRISSQIITAAAAASAGTGAAGAGLPIAEDPEAYGTNLVSGLMAAWALDGSITMTGNGLLDLVVAGMAPAIVGEMSRTFCTVLFKNILEAMIQPPPPKMGYNGIVAGNWDPEEDPDIYDEMEQEKTMGATLLQLFTAPLYYPFQLVQTRMEMSGTLLPLRPAPETTTTWMVCMTTIWREGRMGSEKGLMAGHAILLRNLPLAGAV
eukprot:Clim_evm10s108 gene=Clim_evmTU10s108